MFLTNCLVVIVKYWYFQNRTNFSETLRIPENSKVYVFLKTRGSADGSADPHPNPRIRGSAESRFQPNRQPRFGVSIWGDQCLFGGWPVSI